ncbi:MAG: alpha/beta hydrolase [Pseudomonadota bacterium]
MLSTHTVQVTPVENPVLALHGSAGSGKQWRSLADFCEYRAGFHAPDLLGYGRSSDDERYEARRSLGSRLLPLLEWLDTQTQPVNVVAHSFGATVALELLRARPRAIGSLTLYEPVAPALFAYRATAGDRKMLGELKALSQLVGGTRGAVGMESFMNYWCDCDAWSRFSPETRDSIAAQASSVFDDFNQGFGVAPQIFEELPECVSFSILLGADTVPIAKRMAEKLSEIVVRAETTVLPGLGHLGVFVNSELVNPVLHTELCRAESSPRVYPS